MLNRVIEQGSKLDNFFLGIVEDNVDTLRLKRCKIRVREVYGSEVPTLNLPWAAQWDSAGWGAIALAGEFKIPPIGATVIVLFHRGDVYCPVYLFGGPYTLLTEQPQFIGLSYPNKYGFVDTFQNKFVLDPTPPAIGDISLNNGVDLSTDIFGNVVLDTPGEIIANVASIELTDSGQYTLQAGGDISLTGSQQYTLTTNGDLTISATQSGAEGSSAPAPTLTIRANGAEIQIDTTGKVTILSAGDLDVITNQHNDSINNIINTYNSHGHLFTDSRGDTGTTQVPNKQMT